MYSNQTYGLVFFSDQLFCLKFENLTKMAVRLISKKMQNRPIVKVWCGMTLDRIVDPFLFQDAINAERQSHHGER